MIDAIEVVVIAEMAARKGCEEALRKALEAAISPSRAEPGNLVYRLHEDRKAPGRFFFYERWRDQAAIDAHLQTSHFKTLVRESGPLAEGEARLSMLRALSD